MKHKQKVAIFSILACVCAATTAKTASLQPVQPISIVLPLVAMGIFLFFAGYFAGLGKSKHT